MHITMLAVLEDLSKMLTNFIELYFHNIDNVTDLHTPTYGQTVNITIQLQCNTLTKMHYKYPMCSLQHLKLYTQNAIQIWKWFVINVLNWLYICQGLINTMTLSRTNNYNNNEAKVPFVFSSSSTCSTSSYTKNAKQIWKWFVIYVLN